MEGLRRKILVFFMLLTVALVFYFWIIKTEKNDLHREQLVLQRLNNTEAYDVNAATFSSADLREQNTSPERSTEQLEIPVHIMGEVRKPGVYQMPANALVQDAIERAGGLTEQADLFYINLAAEIEAHQKIYIPDKDEIEQNLNAYKELISQDHSSAKDKAELIHLNTANKEELMQLNGIGESKADAIIAYREEHGQFSNIEDIMNVPGIKENSFKKIKDQITVH